MEGLHHYTRVVEGCRQGVNRVWGYHKLPQPLVMPCLLQGSRGSDSSLRQAPCHKAIPALPDKLVLRRAGVCLNGSTRIGQRQYFGHFSNLGVPRRLPILSPSKNPFLKKGALLESKQGYVGLQGDNWDVCWVQDFGSFQSGPLPLTPLYADQV